MTRIIEFTLAGDRDGPTDRACAAIASAIGQAIFGGVHRIESARVNPDIPGAYVCDADRDSCRMYILGMFYQFTADFNIPSWVAPWLVSRFDATIHGSTDVEDRTDQRLSHGRRDEGNQGGEVTDESGFKAMAKRALDAIAAQAAALSLFYGEEALRALFGHGTPAKMRRRPRRFRRHRSTRAARAANIQLASGIMAEVAARLAKFTP